MAAMRVICAFLLLAGAQCQVYDFCKTGIPKANFAEDNGKPSIEVILAVAPLFSTNPKIGGTLGMLGLYHTAIVLAQGSGTDRRYWTLEFDFTKGSVIRGAVPVIDGNSLIWDDDARYCLTEGLLWGRDHWKKEFDTVATINKKQAQRVFSELVGRVNGTATGSFPQYQLWRIVKTPGQKLAANLQGPRKQHVMAADTALPDVTCADGINWVLHYITHTLGVPAHEGFQYRGTTVWINAKRVEAMNTSDPQVWQDIMKNYKLQAGLFANTSIVQHFQDLGRLFPMKYVYDANTKTYYKLHGSTAPYLHLEYAPSLLKAPPSELLPGAPAPKAVPVQVNRNLRKAKLHK